MELPGLSKRLRKQSFFKPRIAFLIGNRQAAKAFLLFYRSEVMKMWFCEVIKTRSSLEIGVSWKYNQICCVADSCPLFRPLWNDNAGPQ